MLKIFVSSRTLEIARVRMFSRKLYILFESYVSPDVNSKIKFLQFNKF